MFGWLVPVDKTKAKIKALELTSRKILDDQKQLTVAYSRLDQTSQEICSAVIQLKDRDLGILKDAIDQREIPQDYKDKLKTELDSSRKMAIETLVPLRVKAEKLCANMLVSQEKALEYWTIIRAQARVLQSGAIQLKILRELHSQGAKLSQEIEDLLVDCESINNVVDRNRPLMSSVLDAETDSILPPNPMMEIFKNGTRSSNR